MGNKAHGGNGDFVRDPDVAERDRKAMELHARGRTWQQIADELGYSDRAHACKQVMRAYARADKQPVEAMRESMNGKLEKLYQMAMEVAEARHLKVVNGSVVFDPEQGGVMEDDAPVLAAIDRMTRLLERMAKVNGIDAPTKVQAQVQNVKVTVEGAEDV